MPTLPIISFVTSMSLLEQDHLEGASIQERYKMYKNVIQMLRTRNAAEFWRHT